MAFSLPPLVLRALQLCSALLLLCTAAALAVANSRWAPTYFGLLYMRAGVSWGAATFSDSTPYSWPVVN